MAEGQGQERRSWLGRAYHRAYLGQDYLATKLALVFGFGWTIWVFFIVPLLAEFFPPSAQARVFYYASGWIQLFALPLMVYVSNKIQATTDATSREQGRVLEGIDQAITVASATAAANRQLLEHIQELSAGNHTLIQQNVELTELVRTISEQNAELTREVRLAINGRARRQRPEGEGK